MSFLMTIETQQHFVTFLSPGTFVSEQATQEVDDWDINAAVERAHTIVARHGATPYAFYFTTRGRGSEDLDSKEMDRSCQYFLGGKIETLADVEARNDPTESILRSNMRMNDIKRVLVNTNSFKSTMPFGDDDILVDFIPRRPDVVD